MTSGWVWFFNFIHLEFHLSGAVPRLKVKKWKLLSHVRLCNSTGYIVHGTLQTRILQWVPFPFSRESSQPRDRTQIPCIAGGFFNSWTTRETRTRVRCPFQRNSCLLPIPSDFSSLACLSQRAPGKLGCPFSPWTPVPYVESRYSKGKAEWVNEWLKSSSKNTQTH